MSSDATGETFWSDIVGQKAAIKQIQHVLTPEGEKSLSHAWLITGPPGSGRSNLAYRFAAALIARGSDDLARVYQQVLAGTHPDLEVLKTEGLIIKIDQAREVALRAHYSPTQGRYRVIVAEDADRLPEKSSNTLLKALEEPPERTVWILCAPSEADMLPTIRSRTRSLRLVTPAHEDVAALLEKRDAVPADLAMKAARLSQGHIGMARKLALDEEALERRTNTLRAAINVSGLAQAMRAAKEVIKLAEEDAKLLVEERDDAERRELLRNLGVSGGQAIPQKLRAQVKALEEDQKRRARRSLHDAIDRVLVDLLSLYRDALLVSLNAGQPLINLEFSGELQALAQEHNTKQILGMVTAVEQARERLLKSVTPALVVEALFASLVDTKLREPSA